MARPKHMPLDSIEGITEEMERIYLRCKAGKLDYRKYTKLVYGLNSLINARKDIDIVRRLEAVEEAQEILDDVAA